MFSVLKYIKDRSHLSRESFVDLINWYIASARNIIENSNSDNEITGKNTDTIISVIPKARDLNFLSSLNVITS
jgi:hypothetical protein